MLDILHKIVYTGIGFAALTEQKAQEFVTELEKRGDISSEEGKKLAHDLVDKARKQSQEMRKTVREEVGKFMETFKGVTREEFEQLKQRLDKIEDPSAPSPDQDTP